MLGIIVYVKYLYKEYMGITTKFIYLSTITGEADPDFSELFDAFIEYNRTSSPANLNKTQHELINDFIYEMATSLSAYGNAAGYNLPLSY
ncbi:hypothetical protein QO206_08310 [Leeuwenhoekiella aequorea]|uniref:hypothetical protein n=1 Tax=Leeuwenhoekiella aequorea TaxID=283736 RepID=UPI00352D56C7